MITRVRQLRDNNDDAKGWESTLNIKTDGEFSAKKTMQETESFQIPDTKRYGKCGIMQARNMSIIIDTIGYRRRGEEASGTNNGEHIVERAI